MTITSGKKPGMIYYEMNYENNKIKNSEAKKIVTGIVTLLAMLAAAAASSTGIGSAGALAFLL